MVTTLTLHIAFENRSTFDEAYMDNILYLTLKMFVLNVLLLLISFDVLYAVQVVSEQLRSDSSVVVQLQSVQ